MMVAVPKPFPVLATIMAIAGVFVLLGLGHWQQERLIWKNNLQATLDQEFIKDAAKTPLTLADLSEVNESVIKRGTLSGHFDFSKQIILQGQMAEARSVNYVLIPFMIDQTTPIFVVAGYQDGTRAIARPHAHDRIDRVTGVAKLTTWSRFTPENDPQAHKWYRADVPAMAQSRDLKNPLPALFYLESSNYKMDGLKPVAVTRELRNDHRQYMFFWYTMAVVLTGIYFLRFWRKA